MVENLQKKSIGVFCGSANGTRPAYLDAARELGRSIAQKGHGLVFGGASVGTMGVVADAALAEGGAVIGVIPDVIMDREIGHGGLTELHVVRTMHERKALMASRSDAFIALPGGFGTLDEFIEIVTWAQLKIHAKPCVLLNVDGYYDRLLQFLDFAVDEGFIKPENRRLVQVASSVKEALDLIEHDWNMREEVPEHDTKLDELVK
jgi:uncharacterized protein (TIGR00730 family)